MSYKSEHTLPGRFVEYTKRKCQLEPGSKILLAVSGGLDSMVMADLFRAQADSLGIGLTIAHVNHGLRERESDEDENFVMKYAARENIPFSVKRIEVVSGARKGESRQMTARRLRYQAFSEMRVESGCDLIATAHTASDSLESVMMHALRGATDRSARTIPTISHNGIVFRPLLFARRDEIECYARFQKLDFREDSSNRSLRYTRNFLRAKVLPKFDATSLELMMRFTEMTRELDEVTVPLRSRISNSFIHRKKSNGFSVSVGMIDDRRAMVHEEIIRQEMERANILPHHWGLKRLFKLRNQETGAKASLGLDTMAVRERDEIVILKTKSNPLPHESMEIRLNTTVELGKTRITLRGPLSGRRYAASTDGRERLDAGKLANPIYIRTWKPGDRFRPLGMKHSKKISDFLTDVHVPHREKKDICVLEAGGQIAWVIGYRIDERFKTTSTTISIIECSHERIS